MSAALEEHIGYLADAERLNRFRAAIAAVVRPGDLVADVGCGSGVLGMMCLQAGAAKVWGIDSTVMIEAARQTAGRAGWADRYICIADRSHRVTLRERVDVAICDHVGYFGFDYGIIDTLQDARRRFLKPGGTLIPARIRLMLALVQSEACRRKADAWAAAPVPAEFHWLREAGVNSKHAVRLTPEDLLGPATAIGEIDLTVDNPEFISFAAGLAAERDGQIDGLAGWFECVLAPGIWMTNSPLARDAINRQQVFLPVGEPFAVKAGAHVSANVMARPADSLLAWSLVDPASGRRVRHSTWSSLLLSRTDLVRSQPQRVPRLTPAGLARQTVLSYCDGHRTAQEIEAAVLRDHPELLPSRSAISRLVTEVLARDTA